MSRKIIHYSSYLLLAGIHLFFIARILWGQQEDWMIVGLLSAILVSMLLAYKKFLNHHTQSPTGDYKEVLAVLFGAITTYYLAQVTHSNAILASCIIGFAASYIPNVFPKSRFAKELPAAVYCGSFVGMSSDLVVDNIWLLANAGLASGLIFSYAKTTFHGFGGKLGTIAFVGVIIALTIYTLLS